MPYDSQEKATANAKKWRNKNKEHYHLYVKKYQKKNRLKINKYVVDRRKKYPWLRAFSSARQRCTDKNAINYHKYGGRGILFLLKIDEVKSLWVRDKAKFMKKPSIDRIDNNGHYESSNCQFIEFSENAKKRAINAKRNAKGIFIK